MRILELDSGVWNYYLTNTSLSVDMRKAIRALYTLMDESILKQISLAPLYGINAANSAFSLPSEDRIALAMATVRTALEDTSSGELIKPPIIVQFGSYRPSNETFVYI